MVFVVNSINFLFSLQTTVQRQKKKKPILFFFYMKQSKHNSTFWRIIFGRQILEKIRVFWLCQSHVCMRAMMLSINVNIWDTHSVLKLYSTFVRMMQIVFQKWKETIVISNIQLLNAWSSEINKMEIIFSWNELQRCLSINKIYPRLTPSFLFHKWNPSSWREKNE